jgi:hypothetical protein
MRTAKVALRRLDRDMAEEKLNLLQLPSRGSTEASACSAAMPHAA